MKLHTLTSLCIAAALAACASPRGNALDGASGEPRLRVAQAAVASGNLQLGESIYASASAAAPSDTDVQLGYADVLVRLNKFHQAHSVLSDHLKTVKSPQLLCGPLGAIDVIQGEAARAIKEFDTAIAADHGNMRWVVDKAIALDMLGRHADAQGLYSQALAAEPDDVITINNLALSLALSGQKTEATSIASSLAGRSDLPERVTLTYDVLRAADGENISTVRDTMGPGNYEHVLQLAKAIGGTEK